MRLKAGKTEYDLPLDFAKIRSVGIYVDKGYCGVYELPQMIPATADMSHITRAEQRHKQERPKESVPVAFTIYTPKRGRKKSTIVFLPAPSKNWRVDVEYYSQKRY